MGVRPPRQLFHVEQIEKFQLEKQSEPIPPQVKLVEVEKIVEKVVLQDNPQLLEQLNAAYKQVGELRKALEAKPVISDKPVSIVEKLVFRTVSDKKREALFSVASFAAGVFLCWLMRK